jgi:hypothetical protein
VPTTPLKQARAHCLSLPEVVERPSHGAPTFFVGVRLDRGLEWERIADVIEEAYISVARSRLVADP